MEIRFRLLNIKGKPVEVVEFTTNKDNQKIITALIEYDQNYKISYCTRNDFKKMTNISNLFCLKNNTE